MNVFQLGKASGLTCAAGFTAVVAFSACASAPPPPTASLQAAQQAISTAEQAEAGRYSPVELSEARSELISANNAVSAQKMTMAERFANKSRTEAELASAKTAQVKAVAVNDEMARSTGALVEEMKRNSGDKQ